MEVAKEARKGDVVFVDPAYLGVQAYGGSKSSKTSRDAHDAEEAIQKLVDLANTAIENGFSIVYTNEFSDKSKTKKPGRSQEQYAEVWKRPCAESAKRWDLRTRTSPTSTEGRKMRRMSSSPSVRRRTFSSRQ